MTPVQAEQVEGQVFLMGVMLQEGELPRHEPLMEHLE